MSIICTKMADGIFWIKSPTLIGIGDSTSRLARHIILVNIFIWIIWCSIVISSSIAKYYTMTFARTAGFILQDYISFLYASISWLMHPFSTISFVIGSNIVLPRQFSFDFRRTHCRWIVFSLTKSQVYLYPLCDWTIMFPFLF